MYGTGSCIDRGKKHFTSQGGLNIAEEINALGTGQRRTQEQENYRRTIGRGGGKGEEPRGG